MSATYGVVRVPGSLSAELQGGAVYRAPQRGQREGDGEELGDDEYPDTDEDIEEKDPENESVARHLIRNASSGVKRALDKTGSAIMDTVLPIIIDRIIGAMVGRLGQAKQQGERGEIVEGGALAISHAGKARNVILPVARVRNILRTLRSGNQRQVRQQLMAASGR